MARTKSSVFKFVDFANTCTLKLEMKKSQQESESNDSTCFSLRKTLVSIGAISLAVSFVYIVQRFYNRDSNSTTTNGNDNHVPDTSTPTTTHKHDALNLNQNNVKSSGTVSNDIVNSNINVNETDDHGGVPNDYIDDTIASVAVPKVEKVATSGDETNDILDREYLYAQWRSIMTLSIPDRFNDGLKKYLIDKKIDTIEKLLTWRAPNASVLKFESKNNETLLRVKQDLGTKRYNKIKLKLESNNDSFSLVEVNIYIYTYIICVITFLLTGFIKHKTVHKDNIIIQYIVIICLIFILFSINFNFDISIYNIVK